MILPPLELLTERFLDYARGFLAGSDEDRANVQLKIDHSLRVRDLAREITDMESLPEKAAEAAHATALLHDTGRFPQYAKHQSFSDADTENHARLGVRALRREPGLLQGCSPEARGLVLGGVVLHNRRRLPAALKEPLGTVARVVRDSDKLDILAVLVEHLGGDRPANKVVTLGIAQDPAAYSATVLEQVLARDTADYRNMRYTNDFKLLAISWVHGLEYTASARLMRGRGHLDALLDSLPAPAPADPGLERLRDQVRSDLDKLCRGVHV